ncbi:MAG: heavy metal translocating P-type ATPase [Lachnoclostridium sp.]|nr:heavy metal translocating P-type ATPase [Lachnoclostridium sp.]
MTKQLKTRGLVLGIGILIYLVVLYAVNRMLITDRVKYIMFFVTYLVIGFEAFRKFSENVSNRKILDENFLIILATMGAFGVGRYQEAVFVMLLFEAGYFVEALSVDRTKRRIADLINIRPEYATRKVRGREFRVVPSALKLYNIIVIKPGERVPVDAEIVAGTTTLDTKALTGEAMPRSAGVGDVIYSGSINLTGVIEAKVLRIYEDSTVSRIMKMVEEAQNHKSESENFVAKFIRIYTPVVMLLAALTAFVPVYFFQLDWEIWVYRGLVVLIAACPAGLIMSTPVAFLGGIACAARQGILVKGGNYLEDLTKADTFIFDKTGTLTEGVFRVKEIKAVGMSEDELLKIAAHIESYSNHPIAHSLRTAYKGTYDKRRVKKIREESGLGISASYDGERVHIGNYRMAQKYGVQTEKVKTDGTVLYIIIGDRYAGYIVIADEIKEGAMEMMDVLKERYHAVLVMLTGDSKDAGKRVARKLRMDYAYTSLMPEDKMERVEEFLQGQGAMEKVVCVGDGMNDAPILARADVGIAMGALGSAAAIEAADVVLMEDDLPKIIDVIKIAKETLRVVGQNLSFALMIKFLILLFAGIGYISMWEAVCADVGIMIISVINAAWVVKYQA